MSLNLHQARSVDVSSRGLQIHQTEVSTTSTSPSQSACQPPCRLQTTLSSRPGALPYKDHRSPPTGDSLHSGEWEEAASRHGIPDRDPLVTHRQTGRSQELKGDGVDQAASSSRIRSCQVVYSSRHARK